MMKSLFSKKLSFFEIFANSSNCKIFLIFCPKNFLIRAQKTFSSNTPISYAFYSKFATFTDFERNHVFFSEKNPTLFWKKKQLSYVFENSYYFSRILRQFATIWWWKSVKIRIWAFWSGHLASKRNVRFECFVWMIFFPYYKWGRN